mgnify:CR=1 FL=1
MYLSFNNNIYFLKIFLFSIVAILMQIYVPKIWLMQDFSIGIDFFLIFLTFLVFLDEAYIIIFLAFLFGLFQDFVVHYEMLGFYAFLKSVSVYLISYSRKFNHLWPKKIRLFSVFLIYFVHFFIYLIVLLNYNYFVILCGSIIQSFICFILFYFIEKVFYNSKLI